MDRSIRSRTSSTSSVRSIPSTPAVTPAGQTTPGPLPSRHSHRAPSPDQLAASLSRLRAERALSNPATPAPTPNQSAPYPYNTLHPEAIIAGLSNLGGDEGIASSSNPGTPAPTPFSPSPSVSSYIQPEQIAASIARLREEGSVSVGNTQPTTPSATPAYPPIQGFHQVGFNNLGIIPEHLAEGIAGLDHGMDEGLESGSNPCTPIPTPFSPSPAQHDSVLPEQLAAGIHRLKVEEGMSSGGSTGFPSTPAPTPFSHGPGGIKPEDLAASISRLSVIQEQTDTTSGVAINILEATDISVGNSSTLSNYFGSPQGAGDTIFDQLSGGRQATSKHQQRSRSNSSSGFHDVTINTPAKRSLMHGGNSLVSSPLPPTTEDDGRLNVSIGASPIPCSSPLPPTQESATAINTMKSPGTSAANTMTSPGSSTVNTMMSQSASAVNIKTSQESSSTNTTTTQSLTAMTPQHQVTAQEAPVRGVSPQQLDILSLAQAHNQYNTPQHTLQPPTAQSTPFVVGGSKIAASSSSNDLLSPVSNVSVYATPSATSPVVDPQTGFPAGGSKSTLAAVTREEAMSFKRPESPVPQVKIKPHEEAWIPLPECKEVLDNMAATPGTFYPDRQQLTCPGVCVGSDQGDPVRDLVAKYQGENEASKRHSLAADSVTTDVRGLQQLISSGNYRAALNLTAQLLTMYGQGKGKAGQLSKHSQSSLQIWLTRLSLLVKLKLFTIAETEAEPFGDLEKPDLFLQYYPEMYGGRRGSLAPWRMRLLLAQIPGFCGKCTESVDRLFRLLARVRKMIRNLKSGLAVDGSVILDSEKNNDSQEALECWSEHERQVLYALVNCCLTGKDYESAVKCLDILKKVEKEERKASLYSAYGRLYLQVGSLAKAEKFFKKGSELRDHNKASDKVEDCLDQAALEIGKGDFAAALSHYEAALKLCPASSKQERVLKNNQAVCLLYLGRLKEGVHILEASVTNDPPIMQGNPMLNLCTLYELESSYALQKKIGMLGLVSLHCPDSFPTPSLKL